MTESKILQILREIESEYSPSFLIKNRLDFSGRKLKLWTDVAKTTTTRLDDASLNYTLIKAFDVPFASMDDVDLLIENQADIFRVTRLLEKDGYHVRRILLADPLKLTAIKPGKQVIVDIYPGPKWYDFTYAPKGLISSRKVRGRVHGIEAYLPSPELNIYIVATHGYCAGRITLSEILHIITIILKERPNLSLLLTLGNSFHTNHALYCYLRLVFLVLISKFELYDASLEHLLVDLQRDSLTRLFNRWLNAILPFKYEIFPLKIPLKNMAFSGLRKLFRGELDHSIRPYDELLISLRYFYPTSLFFGRFGQIFEKPFRKLG